MPIKTITSPDQFAAFIKSSAELGLPTRNMADILSSGSFAIDASTQVGGIPYGSAVEIYGPSSVGKSTVATCIAKSALKFGAVLWVDYETSFHAEYSAKQGVSVDNPRFAYAQPDNLEDGLIIAEKALESGQVRLIVFDSIAGAQTKAAMESEIDSTAPIAGMARKWSVIMPRFIQLAIKHRAVLLGINHEKVDISATGRGFGPPPVTTPGGMAWKFYSHMRWQLHVIGTQKRKEVSATGEEFDRIVAKKVQIRVTKNKFAPSNAREAFYVVDGIGVDNLLTLIDVAQKHDIIQKEKASYKLKVPYFTNEKNCRGANDLYSYMKLTPQAYSDLLKAVFTVAPSLIPGRRTLTVKSEVQDASQAVSTPTASEPAVVELANNGNHLNDDLPAGIGDTLLSANDESSDDVVDDLEVSVE